jgi:hypothetical protein
VLNTEHTEHTKAVRSYGRSGLTSCRQLRNRTRSIHSYVLYKDIAPVQCYPRLRNPYLGCYDWLSDPGHQNGHAQGSMGGTSAESQAAPHVTSRKGYHVSMPVLRHNNIITVQYTSLIRQYVYFRKSPTRAEELKEYNSSTKLKDDIHVEYFRREHRPRDGLGLARIGSGGLVLMGGLGSRLECARPRRAGLHE